MFLKSIEVQGFKSFANKLTFEFPQGITGIVGPNGSGKSNVADAVRWVLGEQSAKQLRGSKMEDVIFSGTELRKPLGFAYVAITLDNHDHKLDTDYDTVTVSRRVYRSGESEYKINGRNCRLRDIQELFYDTGIGKEGYSIIGQGQIDKILSGKPEDRRELFDEAAGIVKYKRRKLIAQKQLASEQDNLSRVKDILYELEKQVVPLKKQSETARIYLDYKEELKSYDANMYLISFVQIKEQLAEAESRLSIVSDQLETAKQEHEQIKESYKATEEKIRIYDEEISSISETRNQLALKENSLEGEQRLIRSRSEEIERTMSDLEDRIEKTRQSLILKQEEIQNYTEEKTRLEEEIEQMKSDTIKAEQNLTSLSDESRDLKLAIDEKNSAIIEFLSQAADRTNRLERYETMKEQAQIRRSELNQHLLVLQDEGSNQTKLANTFKEEAEIIETDLEEIRREQKNRQDRLTQIGNELVDSRNQKNQAEKSFHELSSRYKTLKAISDRYDGYGGSIRKVMEQKNNHPGIIGVVADIIHVDKRYEIAIETALGGSISNIVTEDEDTAKEMIAYLKTNRFGRATFLPLTSMHGRLDQQADKVRNERGVLGIASELVETDARYSELCKNLLGRVYVVDHIDHALAIARKYRHSLRLVTLEGESLNPGGSLSGGAFKNTGNLLGRHREMDELKQKVEGLEKKGRQLQERIDQLQEEKDDIKTSMENAADEITSLSLRLNTVQIRYNQVQDSQNQRSDTILGIQLEMKELKAQKEELDDKIAKLNGEIESIQAQRVQAENDLEDLISRQADADLREKDYSAQTSDLRVHYANIQERLKYLIENLNRCQQEKEKLNSDIITIEKQCTTGKELYDQQAELLRKAADEIEAGKVQKEETESLLKLKQDERNKLAEENHHFFDKSQSLSDLISDLDKEQFRLNHQKEKLDESRTNLSTYMWDEYGMTYQTAREWQKDHLQTMSMNQLKKASSDIKKKIKELGNINVNAIEEYKEVSSRYEDLKSQHDDLVNAEEKLTGIITNLNTSMARQFKERFTLIQEEFNRIFSLLFGGGKGTLELSDPDNLLETGILINAQPPGKKLQNMLQLSGGEKALTAIALLFAIRSLQPSPFCLLDEIEAALDDANVKRFAEYLHNLTKDTQFIVITHRRGTMNAADVLYGITMQEKGVSTFVSVNLIENELTQ